MWWLTLHEGKMYMKKLKRIVIGACFMLSSGCLYSAMSFIEEDEEAAQVASSYEKKLLEALEHANEKEVIELFSQIPAGEKKSLLEERDAQGATPLNSAMKNNIPSIALILLEHGASTATPNNNGGTSLRYLLRNIKGFAGFDSAKKALYKKLFDKFLLIDKPSHEKLKLVASEEGVENELRMLQDEGFALNGQDSSGETALTAALKSGALSDALNLLQAGANTKIPNKKGAYPLQYLVRRIKTPLPFDVSREGGEVFKEFLTRDNTTDKELEFFAAKESVSLKTLRDLEAKVKIDIAPGSVVAKSAPVSKKPLEHLTSEEATQNLIHAAGEGNLAGVEKALLQGAEFNMVFDEGKSVMLDAARKGHVDIIKALKEADVSLGSKFEPGTQKVGSSVGDITPDVGQARKFLEEVLSVAVMEGQKNVVEYLLGQEDISPEFLQGAQGAELFKHALAMKNAKNKNNYNDIIRLLVASLSLPLTTGFINVVKASPELLAWYRQEFKGNVPMLRGLYQEPKQSVYKQTGKKGSK